MLYTNNADPDQMPHHVTSDQNLIKISSKNSINAAK